MIERRHCTLLLACVVAVVMSGCATPSASGSHESTDEGMHKTTGDHEPAGTQQAEQPSTTEPDSDGPTIALEQGYDRTGSDYRDMTLDTADPALCRSACANDAQCLSFTYVKPGVQGDQARCWLKDRVPPQTEDDCCVSGVKPGADKAPESTMEKNFDRPGSDYRNFAMDEAVPSRCQQACEQEKKCAAYVYVKPGVQGKQAVCWLKSSVPEKQKSDCCISGVRN